MDFGPMELHLRGSSIADDRALSTVYSLSYYVGNNRSSAWLPETRFTTENTQTNPSMTPTCQVRTFTTAIHLDHERLETHHNLGV